MNEQFKKRVIAKIDNMFIGNLGTKNALDRVSCVLLQMVLMTRIGIKELTSIDSRQ